MLPDFVFQTVAELSGVNWIHFKSEVIYGSQVAYAYLWLKVFEPLGRWPMKLGVGDVRERLMELMEGVKTSGFESVPYAHHTT